MITISDKSDKQDEIATQGCCVPAPVQIPKGTTEQVKLLAALADSTRLQIVAMLAAQSEKLCVCEIQAHFDLGQPTISHHLKILREAGLVLWEKRGLWVYYSLNRATLEQATAYLNNLLSQSSLSSLSKSATSAGQATVPGA